MSKAKGTPFMLRVKQVEINTGGYVTVDGVKAVVTSIKSVKTVGGMVQVTGICRELN